MHEGHSTAVWIGSLALVAVRMQQLEGVGACMQQLAAVNQQPAEGFAA
jgi:hypothetical protein